MTRWSWGRLIETLVVIVAGDDAPVDLSVGWMRAPAAVAKAPVKADRGALAVAQIEVQHDQLKLAGERLEFSDDTLADAAAAGPGRHKKAADGTGEGLRFVVAGGPRQLHRAGDDPVEPADYEAAL